MTLNDSLCIFDMFGGYVMDTNFHGHTCVTKTQCFLDINSVSLTIAFAGHVYWMCQLREESL
jgi:hypothetical protein